MIIPKSTNPNHDHFKKQAHDLIDGLNPDIAWKVTAVRSVKKRSNPQNAYHWGVIIKTICDETGNETNDVHEILLGNFVGWETYEVFGQMKKRPSRRSHNMETEMFENFNEYCRAFAASDLGIVIPLPGEVPL